MCSGLVMSGPLLCIVRTLDMGQLGHAGDEDAKIRQTNFIWNSLSTENTS